MKLESHFHHLSAVPFSWRSEARVLKDDECGREERGLRAAISKVLMRDAKPRGAMIFHATTRLAKCSAQSNSCRNTPTIQTGFHQ